MPFLAFLVGVAYLPGATSAAVAGRWSVLAVGIPFMIWWRFTQDVRSVMTPAHWAGAALLAWAAASLLWTPSPWDTMGALWQWALLAGAFWLGTVEDDLEPFLTGLAAAMTVNAAFVLLQLAYIEPVQVVSQPRTVGLFANGAILAQAAVIALIAMLWYGRWLHAIGPAICTFAPMDRSVLLALSLVALCEAWRRGYRLAAYGIIVALLVALSLAWWGVGSSFTFEVRLAIWQWVWDAVTWKGYALGSFRPIAPNVDYVHNEFLQALFELGVPGLLLFAFLFYYVMGSRLVLERYLLLALSVCGALWFPFHMPVTAFAVAVVLGLLSHDRYFVRRAKRRRRVHDRVGLPSAGAA